MCLAILYKYHNEWIAIIRKFGERNYAEDIVQETYIKIHTSGACTKAVINQEVNRAFVWISLRNNYLSFAKEKAKAVKVGDEVLKNLEYQNTSIDLHLANDKLEVIILNEIAKWDWYDSKLFLIYINEDKSFRVLSKETRIGLSSIANTIKACKERIRAQCGEDVEDYLNGEYDKI